MTSTHGGTGELADRLAGVLAAIEAHDLDHQRRYVLVLQAMAIAAELGYTAGFSWDTENAKAVTNKCRVVAYIDLPRDNDPAEYDQVSWHLPEYPHQWDEHTTEDKYARIRAYIARRTTGED